MNNTYQSLEQRIAAFFYLTMPKCKTVKVVDCSEEEQKNLYNFINHLYQMIYEKPDILFNKINEDDGHPNMFNCKSYHKDQLIIDMRKDMKLIDDLLLLVKDIGINGIINNEEIIYDGKISKKYLNILSLNNLKRIDNKFINHNLPFFKALKWFSKSTDNIRRFSTCSFDSSYDYVSDILAPILSKEEGACQLIIDWLTNHNYKYTLFNNHDYKVDYYKNINNLEQPVGISFHGDPNHIGFSMEYRFTGKIPYYCTIRIQNMKTILNNFTKLSLNLKNFIIKINKKCDNCRYCVQTDKTNTRPKAFILVDYQNKNYALCPLYQGFWFSFRDLTIDDAKTIIEFLDMQEKYNLK